MPAYSIIRYVAIKCLCAVWSLWLLACVMTSISCPTTLCIIYDNIDPQTTIYFVYISHFHISHILMCLYFVYLYIVLCFQVSYTQTAPAYNYMYVHQRTWRTREAWWRHQMETFPALLAICAGNSPVPGEFPEQRPVTRSFDVFFDLRLNKQLSKQSRGWRFETLPRPLWRHSNGIVLISRNGVISVPALPLLVFDCKVVLMPIRDLPFW